ncbi:UDP-4-amino-4,6-dideoxy-N-acetyl-beta-L-altrosamine transaminase [Gammaproteobacteria bacterium]|nr:UDP-4-amino-4,6-dideoxy-N-acetyl-beta-L-altrosamine transaminase [Gammaproteobacteria bacterium]
MIPYGRQDISDADIDAVVEILRSDYLTSGPVVPRFERAVADYCDVSEGVAVNSATSALHVACLALDLGPGDWLWTSSNTFVASANCALYCGAKVDFVDIDSGTYNMCPQKLEEKLIKAEQIGAIPKIVIPVHFAGQPCDMPAIYSLAQKYGFKIIEDASHSIGAKYNGIKIGSCTHSDITIFSFHPVKIITTGEGGMATTNDETVANRLRRLAAHGITRDELLMEPRPIDEIWNYQQIGLGYNYRMTELQAALGLSQMKRIDHFIGRRHDAAHRYDQTLEPLPLIIPWQRDQIYSSYHLYPVRIRKSDCGKTQMQVYNFLLENNVAANVHYIPVHRQPYYEKLGFQVGNFPEAEKFHREAISLPMYSALKERDQKFVIDLLRDILTP